MLTRSTGLGRTELVGDIKNLDVKGDYIIIHCKTTDPVKWQVRVALNFTDLLITTKLIFLTRKGWAFVFKQIFKFIIRPFTKDKSYARPDDY
jgi:hypothetical protein